jgi:translation elongation factor EF-Ts
MRHRTPVTAEQLLAALEHTNGDVEAAAEYLRSVGITVSGRTFYRRMAEYGIKPRVQYEVADAA